MGYSPWGPKESDTTERLILSRLLSGNSKGGGKQSKQQLPLLSGVLRAGSGGELVLILSEGRGVTRGQAGGLA